MSREGDFPIKLAVGSHQIHFRLPSNAAEHATGLGFIIGAPANQRMACPPGSPSFLFAPPRPCSPALLLVPTAYGYSAVRDYRPRLSADAGRLYNESRGYC
jgi:hypothetical protein